MALPFTNEPIIEDEPKQESLSIRQRLLNASAGKSPATEAISTQADAPVAEVRTVKQRLLDAAAAPAPAPVAKPAEPAPVQATAEAPEPVEPAKPAERHPADDGGLPYLFQFDKTLSADYKHRGNDDEALLVLVKSGGSMKKAAPLAGCLFPF